MPGQKKIAVFFDGSCKIAILWYINTFYSLLTGGTKMNQEEIKQFIAEKTIEGMPLDAIQDALAEQGVKMRFMELRMLAAGIDAVLEKKKSEKAEAEAKAAAEAQKKAQGEAPAKAPAPPMAPQPPQEEVFDDEGPADEPAPVPPMAPRPPAGNAPRGKTTVTVSPIQRPGYLASGSVTFGSGVTAEWFLDQTGRLALDNPSGQPDQQDVREFQQELRKVFGA